jgi:sphingomyelin phosphodiesterase
MEIFTEIFEESLKFEIKNFTKTGYRSEMFNKYAATLPNPKLAGTEDPDKAILGCAACRLYVSSLMSDRRNGAGEQQLEDSAFNMCRIATSYSIEMCRGIVRLNVEPVIFIVDSRPSLTATQMCALVLQGDCGTVDPSFSFTVNVNPGPQITQSKSIHSIRSPNDMKIIHLTDLHFDENYVEGNNAVCTNSICCRRNDGLPSNPADGGGFWGDYRVNV